MIATIYIVVSERQETDSYWIDREEAEVFARLLAKEYPRETFRVIAFKRAGSVAE